MRKIFLPLMGFMLMMVASSVHAAVASDSTTRLGEARGTQSGFDTRDSVRFAAIVDYFRNPHAKKGGVKKLRKTKKPKAAPKMQKSPKGHSRPKQN